MGIAGTIDAVMSCTVHSSPANQRGAVCDDEAQVLRREQTFRIDTQGPFISAHVNTGALKSGLAADIGIKGVVAVQARIDGAGVAVQSQIVIEGIHEKGVTVDVVIGAEEVSTRLFYIVWLVFVAGIIECGSSRAVQGAFIAAL